MVLHRSDDAEPLNPADILPVLSNAHRWLLVIDEADRVAGDILILIKQLPTASCGPRPFPGRLPRQRLAIVRRKRSELGERVSLPARENGRTGEAGCRGHRQGMGGFREGRTW